MLVVAGGDVAAECGRVLDATALPRPRVVGAASAAGPPWRARSEIAAAVFLDRGRVLRCIARCQGEAGPATACRPSAPASAPAA